VSSPKADTLNTNLASSFRPLHVEHNCFSECLQRLQHLLLIFVAVSVIDFIFSTSVYTVCAATHLEGVVVILVSPDVS